METKIFDTKFPIGEVNIFLRDNNLVVTIKGEGHSTILVKAEYLAETWNDHFRKLKIGEAITAMRYENESRN